MSAIYWGEEDHALFAVFKDIANSDETYQFFNAPGDCAATHGAKHTGVSIFRNFDNSPIHFDGEHTFAALNQWMEAASIPMLVTFSEDYIEPIFGKGKDALILFTNDDSAAYNQVYQQAAEQLNGQIIFVRSGTEDGIQQRLAEFIGVTAADAPTIRLLSPGEDMKKFVFPGSLDTVSVHAIKNYLDEYKSGALRPHLKSEPEATEVTPETILVGTNFERIVNDPSKDVLVKYYAPWCGHCKALAPVWAELAEHVAEIDDLVIAKFDATANEVDGLAIKGYPTLKFYPKDNKDGVEYDADRDLEAFKEWLMVNSSAYKKNFAKHDEL